MSRRLLALAAAAALGACGDDTTPAPTIAFRNPAALVIFSGYTVDDAANLRPYLLVANASRNDLTVVDATDDSPVAAPIELRALVVPVADRPALLAAASLGDGEADLVVAVSAGSSVLQLIRTWSPDNAVVPEASLDLDADVVAIAALPSSADAAGRARIAVALAGNAGGAAAEQPAVAVVEYLRGADGRSIGGGTVVARTPVGFQPLALATLPDDPAAPGVQSEIYAATLDPLATDPAGAPVFGVAALAADLAGAPRVLDARAPTRLVAAARLRERAGASTADDASAFADAPVRRVYAAVDESACGPLRRIDCGIVTLDPETNAIPPDYAGRMPYRAPMRVPGRPLALAVAPPPAVAPPDTPAGATYSGQFMRLLAGATARHTTAVAAVASDDGRVYFLDLGRFETASSESPLATRNTGEAAAGILDPDPNASGDERRLWLVAGQTAEDFPADGAAAAATATITPGYTPLDQFTVTYQGVLPGLSRRRAQVGVSGATATRWLALQAGGGAAPRTEVVRVYHPALGVRADDAGATGDLVVLEAGGREPCEARVVSFLAPTPDFPGGAFELPGSGIACLDGLYAEPPPDLTATVRSRGLVLTGLLGYLGRPELRVEHRLEYPAGADEDELVSDTTCPRALVDWDGALSATLPACDAACRSRCEQVVLARKARRLHNLSYPCDAECQARFPGVTFEPGGAVNGPVLAFTLDVQPCPGGTCASDRDPDPAAAPLPLRDMSVSLAPVGGLNALAAPTPSPGSPFHASGAIAFDRSRPVGPQPGGFPGDAAAGYRFLVAYPADLVYDVSPSVNPPSTFAIR